MTEPKENSKPDLLVANITGTFLLVILMLFAATQGDAFFEKLAGLSSAIQSVEAEYSLLIILLSVPAIVFLCISNYVFAKHKMVFFTTLIFLFSIAEAAIPGIGVITIPTRYLLMATLVCTGLSLLFKRSDKLVAQQIGGGVLILLAVAHVIFGGLKFSDAAYLPIYLAIFLGMFIGVANIFDLHSAEHALKAMAIAGVFATLVHTSAIYFVNDPYINGRFRSYLVLPTNFANGYVLLLVSMIWMAFFTHKTLTKIAFIFFSLTGCYLIYISGTRNAMLSLAISLIIFVYFWKRHYTIYIITLATVGSAAYLGFSSDLDINDSAGRFAKVSEKETRFIVWERAFEYISHKPLWGYGLSANMEDLDKRLPSWEKFDTHNAYLGIWLRSGVLTSFIIILIYLKSMLAGQRLIKKAKKDYQLGLAILPFALLNVIFIAGMFEENLSSKGNLQQIIFGLAVAVIIFLVKDTSTSLVAETKQ